MELEITVEDAVESVELARHLKDPFERLLVAQARVDGFTIVARHDNVERYDVAVFDAGK